LIDKNYFFLATDNRKYKLLYGAYLFLQNSYLTHLANKLNINARLGDCKVILIFESDDGTKRSEFSAIDFVKN
jgi:hypothetical protein